MARTILITMGLILFLLYWNRTPPKEEIVTEQLEVKESQAPKEIKRVHKKINIEKRKIVVKPQRVRKTAKYPQLNKDFVPFDEDGNRYITQIMVDDDKLIYHGDVLLGHTKDLDRFKKQGEIKRGKPKKWHQGVIPFQISPDLPNPDRVLNAIEFINENTHVSFKEREGEKNFAFITIGGQQCYSNVGMIGGKQYIYLSNLCRTREVVHELMHTIGFFHEQNREDRDSYVDILWDNIADEHHMQFKKIPNEFLGVVGRPFDYQSIMLYPSYTFSLNPQEPSMLSAQGQILPRRQTYLSEEDIKRVNLAYPSRAE